MLFHPLAELAPRDTVSRAIWDRLRNNQQVFLDARDAIGLRFPNRFPSAFEACANHGIDPVSEPMPVCPAAHYHIGGITTQLTGRSSLSGLWACGEVASTGMHGANRLASNSLLEAMIFGQIVAENVKADRQSHILPEPAKIRSIDVDVSSSEGVKNQLRDLMWSRVGLVRNHEGLLEALEKMDWIDRAIAPGLGELRNMLTVARLITESALERKESRGVHYRDDYSLNRDEFARHMTALPVEKNQSRMAGAK
jgi:L-aspartate oxidase